MPRGIYEASFVIFPHCNHVVGATRVSKEAPDRLLLDKRALPGQNLGMKGSRPTAFVTYTDSAPEKLVSVLQLLILMEAPVSRWQFGGSARNKSR